MEVRIIIAVQGDIEDEEGPIGERETPTDFIKRMVAEGNFSIENIDEI